MSGAQVVRNVLLAALILLIPGRDAIAQEQVITVHGQISVSTTGQVDSHSFNTPLAPAIERALAATISQWRFDRGADIDAGAVHTISMELSLRLVPDGDHYRLEITSAAFDVPMLDEPQPRPPRFPTAAIRDRVGSRVILHVYVDALGEPVRIHPYQTSLTRDDLSDDKAQRLRQAFERAAITAVKGWRFRPGVVDGAAVGGYVIFPVDFDLSAGSQSQTFFPGPISPPPWASSHEGSLRNEDPRNGDAGKTTAGRHIRLVTPLSPD